MNSASWGRLTADDLVVVREPGAWKLAEFQRCGVAAIASPLARAATGPTLDAWAPAAWLLPHQRPAAQRIAGRLAVFGGALLADAVGLGKTYVSLAVGALYARVVAVVPSSLVAQWHRTSDHLGVEIGIVSHESLSRGRVLPDADFVIVDEAHRFRNPSTQRYDRLARGVAAAHLLLVTATPVVNHAADLVALLRLFLPDHGLAAVGVPSLERLIATRDHGALADAAAVLTVARTTRSLPALRHHLPRPVDQDLGRPPPLTAAQLAAVCERVDGLTFDGFDRAGVVSLLRAHLFHRLASSVEALRLTLRRHLAYIDRALTAAQSGDRLSRSSARHLFGPGDDLQLELAWLDPAPVDGDLEAALLAERSRLLALLRLLPTRGHRNPKAERLTRLLDTRRHSRVIVFTAAVSTATDLASRWGWRRTAVVGAGRARIATGTISVDDALDRFAPDARRALRPPTAGHVARLVATDLVSEGLDLQDADAVVHYDLPWTPVRLAQRVGRVARLGSTHDRARVYWLRPPLGLEARLHLERRIAMKAVTQLETLVPETSRVGAARRINTLLELREQLCLLCTEYAHWHRVDAPGHVHAVRIAVVRGPPRLVAAVRWTRNGHSIPQIVALGGTPPRETQDVRERYLIVEQLLSSPPSSHDPPAGLIRTLWSTCRNRLAAMGHGPTDLPTRRLRRRIVARGLAASRQRDVRSLARFDDVLDYLGVGQPVGRERELEGVLDQGASPVSLDAWSSRCRPRHTIADVEFDGILTGDGGTSA